MTEAKQYRGVVVMRLYQTVYVEADSQEEAEQLMCEQFNMGRADQEMEVTDLEVINGLGAPT